MNGKQAPIDIRIGELVLDHTVAAQTQEIADAIAAQVSAALDPVHPIDAKTIAAAVAPAIHRGPGK